MAEGKRRKGTGSRDAPLDLAHLERQTMGDERLRREVLALFAEQATAARAGLAGADAGERRRLAHRLVGAARAIGAFALAEQAVQLEAEPMSDAAAKRLEASIGQVTAFIDKNLR